MLDTEQAADVHQAARMLFGGRLGRMAETEVEDLVESAREQRMMICRWLADS